jgi:hypothetical protein
MASLACRERAPEYGAMVRWCSGVREEETENKTKKNRGDLGAAARGGRRKLGFAGWGSCRGKRWGGVVGEEDHRSMLFSCLP